MVDCFRCAACVWLQSERPEVGICFQFPDNLYILLESAKAHLLLDNYHDAAQNYEVWYPSMSAESSMKPKHCD